ncbi:HET-domain-containing protein [Cladorrhinum sp. PSN259]|nr:HET-domain-containing protein [Cladorrhinum sp. PSN259]
MWLLNVNSLELEEFYGDRIPRYAILSHVWGREEVSFQDMKSADNRELAKRKSGFSKIRECCSQAKRDGYEWAWIDSCCIDKSSSAELSEAINSMFHWYKYSAQCYVCLADVEGGWTLQELLAPQQIVFLHQNWRAFGQIRKLNAARDDGSNYMPDLTEQVSAITQIPTKYLSGRAALSRACVAQRMSWASRRETTRAEDRAYCLLGLFDISMPILYGEGLTKAFTRLQSEIMRENSDQSILAWHRTDSGSYRLLAETPDDFLNSSMVESQRLKSPGSTPWSAFHMTNLGLSIHLPVTSNLQPLDWCIGIKCEALLNCRLISRGPSKNISLGLLFIDRDSEGRPMFVCWRPPSWASSIVLPTSSCDGPTALR